jgi:hypothetical protein
VEPTRGVGVWVEVEDDGEAFRVRGSFWEADKTWTCPSLGCLATSSPPKTKSSCPSAFSFSPIAATECEDRFNTSCSAIFFHFAVREPEPRPDLVAMIKWRLLVAKNVRMWKYVGEGYNKVSKSKLRTVVCTSLKVLH